MCCLYRTEEAAGSESRQVHKISCIFPQLLADKLSFLLLMVVIRDYRSLFVAFYHLTVHCVKLGAIGNWSNEVAYKLGSFGTQTWNQVTINVLGDRNSGNP